MKRCRSLLLVIPFALTAIVGLWLLGRRQGKFIIRDTGILSAVNVGIICIGVAWVIWRAVRATDRTARWSYLALMWIFLVYGAREADFHRIFTTDHLTKKDYYLNPDVPLYGKAIGLTILLLFAVSAIGLLVRYRRAILAEIRRGAPWAVSFVVWGTLLFVAQRFDKSDLNDVYAGRVCEEVLEATAAVYALLTLWLFGRRSREEQGAEDRR